MPKIYSYVIAWYTVSIIVFVSLVQAELCNSGLECAYNEHCCGDSCCANDGNYTTAYGYGFYNLWYFWFVIIMIMMTCCGACSYVKRRQHYLQQQQAMGVDIMRTSAVAGHVHHHHHHHLQQPTVFGVHSGAGPPVGAFPGPPAYSEVTDKPDQFPKAELGYPNYGFAVPPYSPPVPAETPGPTPAAALLSPSSPSGTNDDDDTTARSPAPYQHLDAVYPPASADSVPASAPPPYTPTSTSAGNVAPPTGRAARNL